jgi:hypothetical protein
MKRFFKDLGTGIIFFLIYCCCSCFGVAAYYGFTSIKSCTGWETIGLFLVSVVMVLMAVSLIYWMGVIPNDTIERLKQKIKDLEDTEDDN